MKSSPSTIDTVVEEAQVKQGEEEEAQGQPGEEDLEGCGEGCVEGEDCGEGVMEEEGQEVQTQGQPKGGDGEIC